MLSPSTLINTAFERSSKTLRSRGRDLPRVGVVVSHPIQYFSPLWALLAHRGHIELSVMYGSDAGLRPAFDSGFGATHRWDIDLTSGFQHAFMSRSGESPGCLRRMFRLGRFVAAQDLVIVHGWATPQTVMAILLCTLLRTPFLFRTDTSQRVARRRFDPRIWWPKIANRLSSGALVAGQRNAEIARALGARRRYFVPFTVDTERFAPDSAALGGGRSEMRARYGLQLEQPTVVYVGKFVPWKRVGDVLDACAGLDAQLFLVGSGPLEAELRQCAPPNTVFAGFVNQAEMPAALACGDVIVLASESEPWGLAINEGMASGLVPVVSSAVGCGPDLVAGLGEVYPVGDVHALRACLERALQRAGEPNTRSQIAERMAPYSLSNCAVQFEQAVVSVLSGRYK